MKINRLCVFCGSSFGNSAIYRDKTEEFGNLLSDMGVSLVYGGGGAGLMGVLAETMISRGSSVIGVIPEMIHSKVKQIPGSELIITPDMHSRKKKMYDMADAFTALPGGLGTLEEISEVYTWQQLGYHSKAVSLYNIDMFFNQLSYFLKSAGNRGFIKEVHINRLIIEADPEVLLKKVTAYSGAAVDKWS